MQWNILKVSASTQASAVVYNQLKSSGSTTSSSCVCGGAEQEEQEEGKQWDIAAECGSI